MQEEPNVLANYKPYTIFNNMVFISGQLPFRNKKLIYEGKVEENLSLSDAKKAIFVTTINMLNLLCWIMKIENFKSKRIKALNIKGYINSKPGFSDHSVLFNEASDTIINILGEEDGTHSRSVIGVNSLPLNSPVEIEGMFSISDNS
tara:strand:+ start:126 stop:566 length:441 start_codon:yes stop_codon:yes gene_type:complete